MIVRAVQLDQLIQPGKVVIVYGPRQAGKTTLVRDFLGRTDLKYRYDTGDNYQIASQLSQCTYVSTDDHVETYDLIVIDEAQKIPNIGNALKLMVDRHPQCRFIATGSSSFELAQKTGESLTGRKREVTLYPISQLELARERAPSELHNDLESFLLYGSYPEVVTAATSHDKAEIVQSLAYSYLLKDILEFDRIRSSDQLYRLLKLLAFQVGSQVSTSELAKNLQINTRTVLRYLDLLEKSFVIFSLGGFSRNLRKEVTKMSKYFFFDTGIRNALVNNFNPLADRDDLGQLWENFLMIERRKHNSYTGFHTNSYFWRTYDQKEIDLVEENSGRLDGFEFKWSERQKHLPHTLWDKTYPEASYNEINRGNYLEFVGGRSA